MNWGFFREDLRGRMEQGPKLNTNGEVNQGWQFSLSSQP
jgi:hypothetical protein